MFPERSKHGTDMAPKSTRSIDICCRSYQLSLHNFTALAGVESMLGQTYIQHGLNVALRGSQRIDTPEPGF